MRGGKVHCDLPATFFLKCRWCFQTDKLCLQRQGLLRVICRCGTWYHTNKLGAHHRLQAADARQPQLRTFDPESTAFPGKPGCGGLQFDFDVDTAEVLT